jgi:hypothetical protein
MPRTRAGAARALALGGCLGARARGGGEAARQCGRSPSPLPGVCDWAGAALEAAGAALAEWRHLDVRVTVAPEEPVALWLYEEPPISELGDGGAAAAGSARPIADLALRGLHVSYVSFATQATRLEVSVKDVLCDDIRPGSTNQFKRLVAPIAAGGEGEGARASGDVLSYLAETPGAGPSQTVLRFGHVDVLLIPEVIFPVVEVFTLPPADPRAAPAAAPPAQRELHTASPAPPPPPSPAAGAGSSLSVFVLRPRVTLVDRAADAASRRVVLEASVMYKQEVSPSGGTRAQAHVQDLSVSVREGRAVSGVPPAPPKPIIEPCSLSVETRDDPLTGAGSIWAVLGALDVWIAYQDVRMLLAMYQSVAAPRAPQPPDAGERRSPKRASSDASRGEAARRRGGAQRGAERQLRVDVGQLRITVVNDNDGCVARCPPCPRPCRAPLTRLLRAPRALFAGPAARVVTGT